MARGVDLDQIALRVQQDLTLKFYKDESVSFSTLQQMQLTFLPEPEPSQV